MSRLLSSTAGNTSSQPAAVDFLQWPFWPNGSARKGKSKVSQQQLAMIKASLSAIRPTGPCPAKVMIVAEGVGQEDERKGLQVKTPSDEFKWNQLGELYQWFTDTYAHLSLQELKAELNENVKSICAMIDSLSADELFKPHMRKWADDATKAAVWEVYRFIHVNTVAPFGTFRTKIRKWKKAAL